MKTEILEINDHLNNNFETNTVVFTDDLHLIFLADNPPKDDINKAIEIVNQFMVWSPNFKQAGIVSNEEFYKSLDEVRNENIRTNSNC